MHLETFLYMLIQSDKTLPPPGLRPDFQALSDRSKARCVPNDWFKVPASEISVGLEDAEDDETGPDGYFGWDNEKPIRPIKVPAFEAQARGITNGDYANYLEQTGRSKWPASWIVSADVGQRLDDGEEANGCGSVGNGPAMSPTDGFLKDIAVRTVYGPVPLAYALHWPAVASFDELSGCAKWMGGRIPTFEELRSIYNYVDAPGRVEAGVSPNRIPAVNG
jgi:L-histidine Nalpha-methyltransferase / hercynylcysteine S-oxide synthase